MLIWPSDCMAVLRVNAHRKEGETPRPSVWAPTGNFLRLPSNPNPLDLFLGHLLVAVVADPGGVRGGVPGDVLGGL